MSVLFYTSSLPGNEIHLPPFRFSDKVVHFCAYAMLGALIAWRKRIRLRLGLGLEEDSRPTTSGGSRDFKGLAVGMLYGVSDEIHQRFVPMRMYDYGDMTADALGAAFGIWLFGKLAGRRGGAPGPT
jgi:hypothetical protein